MRGRHRQHLAQTQLKEFGQLHAFGHAFGLVGRQHRRLAELAQVFRNVVVLGVQPGPGIDHKHHHIGFGHRLAGLFGHFLVDAGSSIRLKATRVDDDVLLRAELAVAVMPVACEPGKVRHNRIPRFGQAVKDRRFAHIRAAHQGNNRFHQKSLNRRLDAPAYCG